MGSLVPLGGDLPDEGRALAEALRGLFGGLGIGVRRYATRRHRDAGSVSRFLNGSRVPPWEFVNDLISDVTEQQGQPPTPEAMELLRRLHREALAETGSAYGRVQLLEDQLADADRQSMESTNLVRALERALVNAQHRAADLELQLRQLHSREDDRIAEKDKSLQLYEDQVTALLRERQNLLREVEALGEQLQDAHTRRARAERRCEELERQLVVAEELWEEESGEADDGSPASGSGTPAQDDGPATGNGLDSRYRLEAFVAGDANRFAHSAATAVAEAPAKLYNPLFVYGTSAIGKTHLLHAIGQRTRRLHPDKRVCYVTAEEFGDEFARAGRDRGLDRFRRRYRGVDVLLLDDIQFLADRQPLREEFLHTFDALHAANKQIVLSSDRPPKQLTELGDRLRNRLESGLITHVQPPDQEARIALLRHKAERDGLVAAPEVLEYIASQIQRNVRELEGALIRVSAFASLNRQPMDVPLAEKVLKDLVPDRVPTREEDVVHLIIDETAHYFGVTSDDLRGRNRGRAIVTARQIAMYLCRELTDVSTPRIATVFGGRDPGTVEHADRKIRNLMAQRRSVYNQMTELTARIKDAGGLSVDRPALPAPM
ncbi:MULTISPECIES: chromosomal replication initiator protein DnaA [unclassified Streptomyces]|uniref:chromosomal replication initiator protein DnaA n=1 Tax=unclassified Streptomyces TaxID=2593676 RepID=UPI00225BD950|nr:MULTISPECIES: chromosomal replication initiator protein DnaA [unclassified Streptomyces]MCX5331005.1 chromosomal replication initiator protein DnaA [Streptomyces sp. NBC_00140]MCX5360399.1 chromosomal replication initiator protein DnaA [Streptomyces sp. NBC_00124]